MKKKANDVHPVWSQATKGSELRPLVPPPEPEAELPPDDRQLWTAEVRARVAMHVVAHTEEEARAIFDGELVSISATQARSEGRRPQRLMDVLSFTKGRQVWVAGEGPPGTVVDVELLVRAASQVDSAAVLGDGARDPAFYLDRAAALRDATEHQRELELEPPAERLDPGPFPTAGGAVRALREYRGFNVSDAAFLMDRPRSTLTAWERGEPDPTTVELVMIGDALGGSFVVNSQGWRAVD